MSRILNVYNPFARKTLSFIAPAWCRLNNKFVSETEIFINTILNINDAAKAELNKVLENENILTVTPNIPHIAYVTPINSESDTSIRFQYKKVDSEEAFLSSPPHSLYEWKRIYLQRNNVRNIDVDETSLSTPALYITYDTVIENYKYDKITPNALNQISPMDAMGVEEINKIYEYTITIDDPLTRDEIYLLPDYIETILTLPTVGRIYKSSTKDYDSRFDINQNGIFWYDDLDVITSYVGINNSNPEWDSYYRIFDIYNKGVLTEEIIPYFKGLLGSTYKVSNVLVVPKATGNVSISFKYLLTEKCIKKSTDTTYYYSNRYKDIVRYDRLGIQFALSNDGVLYYSSVDNNNYIIAPLPLGSNGYKCLKIYNDYLFLLKDSKIEVYNIANKAFPSTCEYEILISTSINITSFAIDNDGSIILCDDSSVIFTRYDFGVYYETVINNVPCYVSTFEINAESVPSRIWNAFTIEAFNAGIYYDFPYEDNFQLRSRLNTIYNLEHYDSIRFIESSIMIDCGAENVISMPDNLLFTFPFEVDPSLPISAKTDNGIDISPSNITISSNIVVVKTNELNYSEVQSISFTCYMINQNIPCEVTFLFPFLSKQYIRLDNDISNLEITDKDIYTWSNIDFNGILLNQKNIESGYNVHPSIWSNSSYLDENDNIIGGRLSDGLLLTNIRNTQMEDIIIDNNILDFDSSNILHQSMISLSGSKFFNWIPKISDGDFVGRDENLTSLYAYFNKYKAVKIDEYNMTLIDNGNYYCYNLDNHTDDKYHIIISLEDTPVENLFKVNSKNFIFDPIENKLLIPKIHANKFLIYNSDINSKNNFITLNIHPFYNNLVEYFLAFSTNETEETGGENVGGLMQLETQYDSTNGSILSMILLIVNNQNKPMANVPVEISINRVFKDQANNNIDIDYERSKISVGGFDAFTLVHDVIGEVTETTENNIYSYKIFDKSITINELYPVMSTSLYMSRNLYMNSILKRARKNGTYKLYTLNKGGLKYERNNMVKFKFNATTDAMGKVYFEYVPPTFNIIENYIVIKATNLSNNISTFKTIKILPYEQINIDYSNRIIYPSVNDFYENVMSIFTLSADKSLFTIHVPYNISNLNSLFILSSEDYYYIYTHYEYNTIQSKAISYSINSISLHHSPDNTEHYYSISIRSANQLTAGTYVILYNKISHYDAIENSTNFMG